MRLIALYLPQYYPTETNNNWYGEGFTEWNNVLTAKKLFKGHYEPHEPEDLGFYDLRMKEVRRAQAQMAERYGIEAFCYWTYWFGGGKTELDMPIWEVYKDKEIVFPFCLGWANSSWEGDKWEKSAPSANCIIKQKYLGELDYTSFFYRFLPLFRDKRYLKVDGKPFFMIHYPFDNKLEIKKFINCWNRLAKKEGLERFYFVGTDSASRKRKSLLKLGFDATVNFDILRIHHDLPLLKKIRLGLQRKFLNHPTVFQYKEAIGHMINSDCKIENLIPVIAPNWDNLPRKGGKSFILTDCKPKYFRELLNKVADTVRDKEKEHQIVIVQSWNEWGEGNHLEPDKKYGKAYLEAIFDVLKEGNNE